jgi:5'-deoxynucleotidase YfbR-like HD superfamily hydrolase
MKDANILDKYGDVMPLVLSSQIRYNNRIRIKDEDLAQHSYYVAYNIIQVGYDYKIKKEIVQEAVCRAIFHDLDEQFTSDIPHDCKVEYPQLKSMVTEIGFKYIIKNAPFASQYFIDYSQKKDLSNLLIDIGDAISVLQYTNREILLGNSTDSMKIISNEVKARIVRLFDELTKRMEEKNDNNS